MKYGAFLCVVLALLLSNPANAQEINAYCPVMTEEKVDPQITTTFQGRTIAFCCDRCMAKFIADPKKYIGHLPQFAGGDAGSQLHDDDQQAEDGEQHQHGGPVNEAGDGRMPWLGRIHPALVHFPLAGLPIALLGFGVWTVTRREVFARADVLPLLVGTLASVAAVITGNIAHDAMRFSESQHEIVEKHQLVSTTVMIVALCLSVFRIWCWERFATATWRWVYGVGLVVVSGLLGVTGYLGGSLVFGPDHMKWW